MQNTEIFSGQFNLLSSLNACVLLFRIKYLPFIILTDSEASQATNDRPSFQFPDMNSAGTVY